MVWPKRAEPERAETTGAAIMPATAGDSQTSAAGDTAQARPPRTTPQATCGQWKWRRSRHERVPSSRCCGVQPASLPSRIETIMRDCMSMATGAMRAVATVSKTHACRQPQAAAGGVPHLAVADERDEAHHLRPEEDRAGQRQHRQRALRIDDRQHRQADGVGEVLRPHELHLQRKGQPGADQQQPEQRGDVGHDAVEEVEAADPVEAARADDAGVLQVALAPAAVARGEVDQRCRRPPRRSRGGRRRCARCSRRGGSARPRRSRG